MNGNMCLSRPFSGNIKYIYVSKALSIACGTQQVLIFLHCVPPFSFASFSTVFYVLFHVRLFIVSTIDSDMTTQIPSERNVSEFGPHSPKIE